MRPSREVQQKKTLSQIGPPQSPNHHLSSHKTKPSQKREKIEKTETRPTQQYYAPAAANTRRRCNASPTRRNQATCGAVAGRRGARRWGARIAAPSRLGSILVVPKRETVAGEGRVLVPGWLLLVLTVLLWKWLVKGSFQWGRLGSWL